MMALVTVRKISQLLCFCLQGDNPGGVHHGSGGHGGLHVDFEPGTPVGSVPHCWHIGVSVTSNLLNWKTLSTSTRTAGIPEHNNEPLFCLLTDLRRCTKDLWGSW